jgi:hypothetical protein
MEIKTMNETQQTSLLFQEEYLEICIEAFLIGKKTKISMRGVSNTAQM